MFFQHLWHNPDYYLVWVAVVTFSICVHEFTHAWAAFRQGDATAAENGYLTLNPLKVMGTHSIIILLLFGIAWGAVPVTHRRMRKAYSPALVAASGPLANLLLALVFAVLTGFLTAGQFGAWSETVWFVAGIGVKANCFLMLFNMLPIPMFDGWEFYSWLFPALKRINREAVAGASFMILILIFMTPLGAFFWSVSNILGVFFISIAARIFAVLL